MFAQDYYTFSIKNPSPESFKELEFAADGYNKELFFRFALRALKSRIEQTYFVGNNLAKIKAAVTNVKEKRLLDLIQVQGVMRAHDDLSRAFYRTLSELRRQQSWRQKIGVIDVTPEQVAE